MKKILILIFAFTLVFVDMFGQCSADFNSGNYNAFFPTYFNCISQDNIEVYEWDFGDGSHEVTDYYHIVHYYQYEDTFTVKLKVSGENCLDSVSKKIFVKAWCPSDVFNEEYDELFDFRKYDDSVKFVAHITEPPFEFTWNFGDGSYSSEYNPSHVYLDTGYYETSLIVKSKAKECADTAIFTIPIGYPHCFPKFSYENIGHFFSFYQESFVIEGAVGIQSYTWNFGDGSESIDFNRDTINHHYDIAGNVDICLTIRGYNNTCEESICKQIELPDIECNVDFNAIVNNIWDCSVTLENLSNFNGQVDWSWDFGDAVISEEFNPLEHYYDNCYYNSYNICLYGIDENFCEDKKCIPIDFIANIKEGKQSYIDLYPNPVKNKFSYDTSLKINKIVIRSLSGIVVREINLSTRYVDVSNLSSGIYLVEFYNGKEKIVEKLVKL